MPGTGDKKKCPDPCPKPKPQKCKDPCKSTPQCPKPTPKCKDPCKPQDCTQDKKCVKKC